VKCICNASERPRIQLSYEPTLCLRSEPGCGNLTRNPPIGASVEPTTRWIQMRVHRGPLSSWFLHSELPVPDASRLPIPFPMQSRIMSYVSYVLAYFPCLFPVRASREFARCKVHGTPWGLFLCRILYKPIAHWYMFCGQNLEFGLPMSSLVAPLFYSPEVHKTCDPFAILSVITPLPPSTVAPPTKYSRLPCRKWNSSGGRGLVRMGFTITCL